MSIFREYAGFYDSLYEDKDYQGECNFVRSICQRYTENEVKSILDLGCGTGTHALCFADMGYVVTGVDFSEEMLKIAGKKAANYKQSIQFSQQDIRHLEIPQKFDTAIAMFAVVSYLTANQDLEDALMSVHRHLTPGGLFIFDVWFGPAALMQKPARRIKIIEQGDKKIVRYVYPELDIINHTVKVNYTVYEFDRGKRLRETKESHLMRFFFYQELEYYLEKSGFEILRICPFMDLDGEIDKSCWNISVIASKSRN
ncbi:class I SAM-dependent DNA methyltransferase [Chloroflexota bacterium]